MYPDWPASASDLVPLPPCDGPKLKPFDFKGPQKIEFLEYVARGAHGIVFKVRIQGTIYALKLFRFDNDVFPGPSSMKEIYSDREAMAAFYNYQEPFNAECRAFGRLKESGHADLAIPCFGYVLLDEDHERALMGKDFSNMSIHLGQELVDNKARHRANPMPDDKNSKLPPIRGIVKAFGEKAKSLGTVDIRRLKREACNLQQLGIFNLDFNDSQVINHKMADFSAAITVPHFLTTPDLNPQLSIKQKEEMELETFCLARADFYNFDQQIEEYEDPDSDSNLDSETPVVKRKLGLTATGLPRAGGLVGGYDLRKRPHRLGSVFTFVDPRRYLDCQTPTRRGRMRSGGDASDKPWRIQRIPPRWEYKCSEQTAQWIRDEPWASPGWFWEYKNGLMFPRVD